MQSSKKAKILSGWFSWGVGHEYVKVVSSGGSVLVTIFSFVH